MRSAYRFFFLSVLLLLVSSPAHALLQFRAGAVVLPTTGRPTSLAATADGTFLVGTVGRTRFDELFAAADSWRGPVTGLVNNAGVSGGQARVDEVGEAALDEVLRVNVAGPFLCAGAAVRRMSTRHGGSGGSIVNMSSRAAAIGSPGKFVHYAATKAALDTLTVGLSVEVAAEGIRVNGIAVDGTHAYLATADDAAELMVVDLTLRQRVASFDVPGTADGWSVSVAEPGVVDLVVRRSAGPERYRLSVATDPISVLSTAEDPTAGKPTRPEGLRRYRIRGRLVARERRVIPGGALHYVLSTDRRAQFQVVEEVAPVGFADLDGDGVYRLGCVGDSNTSLVSGLKKWCEIIRDGFSDPDFAVINVAVNGATVNPNLRFTSDATMQMAEVLSQAPDLLVLAFGTNDVFQGRTPQQIHDAYLAQQPTADAAGVPFYVATTPPIIGCPNCTPGIEQGNDMLRATFAGRVVEFYTGFGADEFNPDHYHLNSVGQQLRAERALEVLGR